MNTAKTGQLIQYGFIAAGLYNLVGILVFSAGFTNDLLAQWYPEVFSLTGQIGIVLWGVAYIQAVTHRTDIASGVLIARHNLLRARREQASKLNTHGVARLRCSVFNPA